ncbi:hypothetical protein DEQ92_19985 [Haloferax sp. Atlit-6N]|uniref:Uncharacterized protein n=1 Tax=Haloferax gibbonsii TaxID=35746 RepID=A0A871BL27_HALGI|nr:MULTISPECIES: hypothetical protein [Haloferax]QOS13454.1 uncharacterized protein HfgLR_21095 [Haloferax gibbonsii]REA00549.1 hypothetical protein DEQ92_19985 [Haloferax sp. Atlit-6N]
MTGASRSRWSRRFIIASAVFFVCWRLGATVGITHRVEVILALFGFVSHVVFGMAYLLVPSYFGTTLSTDTIPPVHFVAATLGTVLLAFSAGSVGPTFVETLGALVWGSGVAAFVAALSWSVRNEVRRGETGTSSHRESYEWVDKYANRYLIIPFAYLAVGSYELLARTTILPGLTDGYFPRITHLIAAGFAVLLVFTLGVRLSPRFLGVPVSKKLAAVVLPAGAVGPVFVAAGLGGGPLFVAGAVSEAIAFVGFAALYLSVFSRSDRRRVGTESVLAGVIAGVVGVAIGLTMALWSVLEIPALPPGTLAAHRQLNLLGFLGLVIVGFTFLFYPPSAGRFRGASERTAQLIIAALLAGLVLSVLGRIAGMSLVSALGDGVALLGSLGYGYLLVRLLIEIGARRTP